MRIAAVLSPTPPPLPVAAGLQRELHLLQIAPLLAQRLERKAEPLRRVGDQQRLEALERREGGRGGEGDQRRRLRSAALW